jgi:hypothetical protein
MTGLSLPVSRLFLPTALSCMFLAACQDTVIYGERSGFNLNIRVGEDPKTPVQVNAGLRRLVAAYVPPTDVVGEGDQQRPSGEAVSLFSGFRLRDYDRTVAAPLGGTLVIRTQFASGLAAQSLAGNPDAVRQVVNVNFVHPVSGPLQQRREAAADFVKTLDQTKLDALAASLGEQERGDKALLAILRRISAAESTDAFDVIAEKLKLLFNEEV